jgi:hypothetical protein
MPPNLASELPWLVAFVIVLALYLYVRSRRTGKK